MSSKQIFNKIVTGSMIFYVVSGITSALNYIFYPIIARIVSINEYGEIQFLTSIFNQISIGFVILNILSIIVSSSITEKINQRKALKSLNLISVIIISIINLICLLILFVNKESLAISSLSSLIAISLCLLVNVPLTTHIGQLQGNNRFARSGIVGLMASALKLIFSILFIIMGWGVLGALSGIFLGMLLSLLISTILSNEKSKHKLDFSFDLTVLSFIKNKAIILTIAILALTIFSSLDLIYSRILLTTEDSGRYALIATISKMIAPIISPLMWIAIPFATKKDFKNLLKYIKISVTISLLFIIATSISPDFILNILFNTVAGDYISFMTRAALSMALYSISLILICSNIMHGKSKQVLLSVVVSVVLYISMTMSNNSFEVILNYQVLSSVIIFIINIIELLRSNKAEIS